MLISIETCVYKVRILFCERLFHIKQAHTRMDVFRLIMVVLIEFYMYKKEEIQQILVITLYGETLEIKGYLDLNLKFWCPVLSRCSSNRELQVEHLKGGISDENKRRRFRER